MTDVVYDYCGVEQWVLVGGGLVEENFYYCFKKCFDDISTELVRI